MRPHPDCFLSIEEGPLYTVSFVSSPNPLYQLEVKQEAWLGKGDNLGVIKTRDPALSRTSHHNLGD